MSTKLPTLVDVRLVEPKHRLETIMTAYDALRPGEVLDLIVDHEPQCMYYTLEALHGAGTFTFVNKEDGPEVWRVEVGKTAGG